MGFFLETAASDVLEIKSKYTALLRTENIARSGPQFLPPEGLGKDVRNTEMLSTGSDSYG